MKTGFMAVVVLLFITSAPSYAQTGATGTWRVEGVGNPFPWEVFLEKDGPGLRGVVNSCASFKGTTPFEISNGKIDGNTITFTCQSGDGERTISFTGRLNGDEIAFMWTLKVKDGGIRDPRVDGMFGSSAPHQFIAKRVPDGELAKTQDVVRGMEFAAAVNLIPKDLKAEGMLFVPRKVTRARAVLVVINYGLGFQVSVATPMRQLAETLGAAILGVQFSGISRDPPFGTMDDDAAAELLPRLCERLAQESGHQELVNAPFLFWGHSAAAVVVTAFASRFPNRTLGFVRYQGGAIPGGEVGVVRQMPALFLAGGKDETAPASASESLWKNGRSLSAPWTFAVQPDATHGDPKDLERANNLVIPWITAVFRERLSPDSTRLRVLTDGSAWLGNNQTGDVAQSDTFSGSKAEASWLPDETSARGWQLVMGVAK